MRGQDVTLDQVSITYPNGFTAVQSTDLHIQAGEFFSILGPSGCGKTTLLRAISGFVDPTQGAIKIGGQNVVGISPKERPTALIFQNLALFPLMKVWENVAFGLEARGISKKQRKLKAQTLLDLVALGDQGEKLPSELSGGQRQRVAVARALAVEPAVLLLDEPLSALDLKLRQHMRAELCDIQRKTGVTFIYITHDQGEALTMSDRIAVMNNGIIEQVGTADDIYSSPTSSFVASFVGESNQFCGRVQFANAHSVTIETANGVMTAKNTANLKSGDMARLFIRPELTQFGEHKNNKLSVSILRRTIEGAFVTFECRTPKGEIVTVHQTNTGQSRDALSSSATVCFDAADAIALNEGPIADTGRGMRPE